MSAAAPGRPAIAGVARPLRALSATVAAGVLVGSALQTLCRYRLTARFGGGSPSRAVAIMQRWSARACGWLRLDVQLHGAPSSAACVYVANHRSYLDVPVLASVLGASFMSRGDVAGWPVVGSAARAMGAVFVDRDDTHGRVRAALALVRRLDAASVVVFPEGTTGGERLPGAFHPGLFRLLHRVDARVMPVTVRYGDRRAYWTEDVSLARHLRTRMLGAPRMAAAVHVGQGFGARAHVDASSLADATYRAVCAPIEAFGELVN